MESDEKKASEGEGPKEITIIQGEDGSIALRSNFRDLSVAIMMCEMAKLSIWTEEQKEIERKKAQAIIVANMRDGIPQMPGRRPN